ncbi:MAG: MCE family protein [Comamonadaceae bacterium]|nr:MAG: MCE family protein [Comamonadaceae bacterium]
MENKAHALAAGAFVLVVTALLALLGIWLTRDSGERVLYELSTRETISGLQPQAAVRFRGVPVGKVETIGFDSKIQSNVLIRISVEQGTPITKSTYATISSQGVTGLGFIQLEDKGESKELLATSDENPSRIPLNPGLIDKLLKQSEVIFDQIETASNRINRLLSDENQKAFNTTLTQLGEAATGINKVAQGLQPTVAGLPKLSSDTSAALKSVQTAADEFAVTAKRLNAPDGPLEKLSQGGEALAAGVETFSAATLPKLGEVADETARAMRQLRRTVSAVDDNPQSLIFGNGPPQPGPGEPGFSAKGAQK